MPILPTLETGSNLDSNCSNDAPRPRFFQVLTDRLRSPQHLIFLWNWKNALLSLVLRGPIFLIAASRKGWESALGALLTESVFCVVTAGFYGAVVQSLRNAEPESLTGIFLTLVMPAIFQVLEYWLHWLRGTPHLRTAEITSVVVSAISALLNWYAMRRGTLLVGGEGRRFGADLRRLPFLVFGFVALMPRRLVGRIKHNQPNGFHRTGSNECK